LLWHLGDVLNATALLPDLAARHHRPLSFATTRSCVPILENNPHLSDILMLDERVPEQVSLAEWARLQTLGDRYFPGHSMVYNLHMPIDLRRVKLHLVQCWARALGMDKPLSELRPSFLTGEIENQGHRSVFVLGNGGTTSRWKKQWPIRRWSKLIPLLEARYPDVEFVQLGTDRDPLLTGVKDLRNQTTITESYNLLKYACGCLTNDSFLAHLAAVAGCPLFVIFGPTSPTHYRPLGDTEIRVLGGHRYSTPCSRNLCRLSFGLAPCFAFPTVRQVLDAVDEILDRGKGSSA